MLLEVRNIRKTFGSVVAVDDVTFAIPDGKICGFLGPNGAGKTTLIRMVLDIFTPDCGTISLSEKFLDRDRKNHIGYLPEERGLYTNEKVHETLVYFARLKGMRRSAAINNVNYFLHRLEMMSVASSKIQKLSKGNQQKIQLIAAMVSRPDLLILDEPFTGLDPLNIRLVMDTLHELHRSGSSIILSTHRMNEVEAFCHNILLFNRGQLVLEGPVADIIKRYSGYFYYVESRVPLADTNLFQVVDITGTRSKLSLGDGYTFKDLLRWLSECDLEITSVTPYRMPLSEIFIHEVARKS